MNQNRRLCPPMSKYFVVALLVRIFFLIYPYNRYEHKSKHLKHSRTIKIIIKSLAPHKNVPPKIVITSKRNLVIYDTDKEI